MNFIPRKISIVERILSIAIITFVSQPKMHDISDDNGMEASLIKRSTLKYYVLEIKSLLILDKISLYHFLSFQDLRNITICDPNEIFFF